jgi:hypothetical protein
MTSRRRTIWASLLVLVLATVTPISAAPPQEEATEPATGEVAPDEPEKKKRKFQLKDKWGGEWVPAPIPTTNPTIGSGLALALLYLRALDEDSPPSSFGVMGFRTDSDSRGVGIGARTRFLADRFRVNGGYADFTLNYDFFGIGEDAGDRGQSIPLNQTGDLYSLQFLTRLPGKFYLGPQWERLEINSTFDLSNLPTDFPLPPSIEFDTVSAALGIHLTYDSKNYEYNPSKGTLFDLETNFFGEYIGGDFDFQQYTTQYNRYLGIKGSDDKIVAVRGTFCYATDDAPFFQLCMLGFKDAFRGYVGGQYRDQLSATAQAEYRWRIWKRLGMVFFAGAGQVAESFDEFDVDNWRPSAGAGLRVLIGKENRINYRIDYARGKNSNALYMSVGEAF